VGDHPFLGVTATALAFLRRNTTEAAPLANGEFGFAEDLGDLGSRVVVLDHSLADKPLQECLDAVETVE
jgi:hypothetical protein